MAPVHRRERHRSDRSARSDRSDRSDDAGTQAHDHDNNAAAAPNGGGAASAVTPITTALPPLGQRAGDVAPEDIVQAVILADSFNRRLMPLTVPQPKVRTRSLRGARFWSRQCA